MTSITFTGSKIIVESADGYACIPILSLRGYSINQYDCNDPKSKGWVRFSAFVNDIALNREGYYEEEYDTGKGYSFITRFSHTVVIESENTSKIVIHVSDTREDLVSKCVIRINKDNREYFVGMFREIDEQWQHYDKLKPISDTASSLPHVEITPELLAVLGYFEPKYSTAVHKVEEYVKTNNIPSDMIANSTGRVLPHHELDATLQTLLTSHSKTVNVNDKVYIYSLYDLVKPHYSYTYDEVAGDSDDDDTDDTDDNSW